MLINRLESRAVSLARTQDVSLRAWDGLYSKFVFLQVSILDTWQQKLGDGYPTTLNSMLNLVRTPLHAEPGELKRAKCLEIKALNRGTLGPENPKYLSIKPNLAHIYIKQYRLGEVRELLTKVLDVVCLKGLTLLQEQQSDDAEVKNPGKL